MEQKLSDKIIEGKEMISLIGLGYVGMPIAVAFAKHTKVVGFDLNKSKIELYKKGIDPTNEVGNQAIKETSVEFTNDESELKKAKFHIVAVPTPINQDKTPDLSPVIGASEILGRNLEKGSIVVFESTVYPGVTEEICAPILERESGFVCGKDFKIGYSPERINPGDKIHTLENIRKIVSGMDEETVEEIAKVYQIVIKAGVYKVSSIKVAEAAKVVENSQRDINIAFMNELAMVFDKMGIDSQEVVNAMDTKWNALGFRPGLVGGHCIGVDPYYFIYQAEKLGYHSQIIASGRKVNDSMGKYVADAVVKQLVLGNKNVKNASVYILGITFKANCPDIRNSKVVDIIENLSEYGILPKVIDPLADKQEVKKEYKIELSEIEDIKEADCLVFAVEHNAFRNITLESMKGLFKNVPQNEKIIIDVKGMFEKNDLDQSGYRYWRL